MYSIKEKITTLLEINKSKFYCILIPINNIKEIDKILSDTKQEYKDATHYCYAYIFDQVKRFNDDGEPSGTAGMPILNVLENNNLDHILAIVIRYFGGIKLGAGGLVRAYTNSVCKSISDSSIIELIKGKKIKIEFKYENLKQLDYLLKNEKIADKHFENNIIYILNSENIDIINKIKNYIINYNILDDIYIKKSNG